MHCARWSHTRASHYRRGMHLAPRSFVLTVALACCRSAPPTGEDVAESLAAKRAFMEVLVTGDLAANAAARDRMIAAFDRSPDDNETARFIAFSYMLAIAEGTGPQA